MSVQLITQNQKKKIRKFTPKQKLEILKQWERTENGIQVAEKHQIHPATLYRWKKALEQGAEIILKGKRPKLDPQEKENQSLKEALSFQSQELMLLKKEMNLV